MSSARITVPFTARLFTSPQRDGTIGHNNDNVAALDDYSSGTQGRTLDMTARVSLTRHLDISNTGVKDQSHNHPFRDNQNSNSTLTIINSNRHEDYHVIIKDSSHDNDENNNLLVNVNEAVNEVNIDSPTASNETKKSQQMKVETMM